MSSITDKPTPANDSSLRPLGPNAGNPRLASWQLTLLLIGLAVVPSSVTVGLWFLMPGVQEGKLPVQFEIAGVPDADYYQLPAEKRAPIAEATIKITNQSQQDWDVLNVVINNGYEIRDPDSVLKPGQEITYELKRFYNRSGITFQPELAPVTYLRIFARVGKTKRQSVQMTITADDYNRKIDGAARTER